MAFAILLPVAAHRLWDYIEIRRLVSEIEAIRSRGEPVSEREAAGGRQPLPGGEHNAASYYLAGAMLALGTSPARTITPVREWLASPNPDREALLPLTAPLHELVARSRDALMLADKAAVLSYDGFPAGTEHSYRAAGIGSLSELITARTLSASHAGRAEEAVDSAISGLQIGRALRDARWRSLSGHQVAAVLSLTRPSAASLSRLQAALEAEDKPERTREAFLRERARYVELVWRRYYGLDANAPRHYTLPMRSLTETVMRPWFTHHVVDRLRLWAQLVEVASMPWPERVRRGGVILAGDEARRAGSRNPANFHGLLEVGIIFGAFSQAIDATELVVDRTSRVAVAIERYRRDHDRLPGALSELVPQYLREIPDDPFSGGALRFRSERGAYTVYGVGHNQQDDGGDLSSELERVQQQGWGRRLIRGTDVGVRVLIQE